MHGCFHCGEVGGEVYLDELGRVSCKVCETRSVVNFVTALDLLCEVDIQGNLPEYTQEFLDVGRER